MTIKAQQLTKCPAKVKSEKFYGFCLSVNPALRTIYRRLLVDFFYKHGKIYINKVYRLHLFNMKMLRAAIRTKTCFRNNLAEFYYCFALDITAIAACEIPSVFYIFAAIRTIARIFVRRNFWMCTFFFSVKKHLQPSVH